jgi:hypothetical protein
MSSRRDKIGSKKEVPAVGTEGKKMTRILSFQPTPENREMLQAAINAGLSLTDIINAAVSKNGEQVARKMAEEAKRRAETFLAGGNKG